MKKLFNLYRVLAYLVGILLLGVYAYTVTDLLFHDFFNQHAVKSHYSWVLPAHGFLFMIYCLVAFVLSRRAGWTFRFLVVLVLCGILPILIFWVERLVEERVRPWIAEEAQMSSGSGAVSGS